MNIEKYSERVRGFIQSAQTYALAQNHQQFLPEQVVVFEVRGQTGKELIHGDRFFFKNEFLDGRERVCHIHHTDCRDAGTEVEAGPSLLPGDTFLNAILNKGGLVSRGIDIGQDKFIDINGNNLPCLLYTSPSPRDRTRSRMPSSACTKKPSHL